LDVAGGDQEISWKDENGKEQHFRYLIPNFNQCKGCHLRNQKVEPIGPSARQLNGILKYPNGQKSNQLEYWEKEGILTNLPKDRSSIPAYPAWENGKINDVDAKAIAYLDINCSHCHNPAGPAASSGLYFSQGLKDPKHLGVFKTPVAAGRGSGGFLYDIVPGKPEQSILIYRMKSRDPGIMMPELSRQLLDDKGIQLVTQWIEQMK
ncbi:MAG: hypothetical protein ABIV51_12835, partial [Saprospiraceae bacterium]